MEYLRKRESQREYERLVHGLRSTDTSLHIGEELKNPMDSAQNAICALLGALTVGFFFYYTTHRQLGEAMSVNRCCYLRTNAYTRNYPHYGAFLSI